MQGPRDRQRLAVNLIGQKARRLSEVEVLKELKAEAKAEAEASAAEKRPPSPPPTLAAAGVPSPPPPPPKAAGAKRLVPVEFPPYDTSTEQVAQKSTDGIRGWIKRLSWSAGQKPPPEEKAGKEKAEKYFKINMNIKNQNKKKYFAIDDTKGLILFSREQGKVTEIDLEKFIQDEEVRSTIIGNEECKGQLISNLLAEKVSFDSESARQKCMQTILDEEFDTLEDKLKQVNNPEDLLGLIRKFKGSVLQNQVLADTALTTLKSKEFIDYSWTDEAPKDLTVDTSIEHQQDAHRLITDLINVAHSTELPDLRTLHNPPKETDLDPVVVIKELFKEAIKGEEVDINVTTGVAQFALSMAYGGKFWNFFRRIGNFFLWLANWKNSGPTHTETRIKCNKNKYVENLTTLIEQVDRLMDKGQRKEYLDQIIVPLVREYAKELNTIGVDKTTHEKLYTAIIKIDPENELGLINNEGRFTYYEDTPTLSATRSKSAYFGLVTQDHKTTEAKNIYLQKTKVEKLLGQLSQLSQSIDSTPTPS